MSHINVDACQGVIHLRGELPSPEAIDRVTRAVRRVAGVETVESYLHLPGQPAPNKESVLNTH
jgi:osmotically-inducible protein OsmY